MKKLLYGMIGGGPDANMGQNHRKAIDLCGNVSIAAGVFSRDWEKNACMAQSLGIEAERCYRNYEEMAKQEALREDGIDFVVVVTPNNSHYEICKSFLNAGIPVVCDKPLTTTWEESKKLVEIVEEKKLPFMVTYTYTGHHMFRKLRDMIRRNKLGNIRKIMAEYPQCWLGDESNDGGRQGRWRMDPRQSGNTNCLGDIGCHIQNAVSTLTGLEISEVLAQMNTVVPGRILDDDDVVLVKFKTGQSGCFWSCQYAYGYTNDLKIRIMGERGTAVWCVQAPDRIELFDTNNTKTTVAADEKDVPLYGKYKLPEGDYETSTIALSNLYEKYIANLINRGSVVDYPTVRDGAESIKYIEACIKSNKSGNSWVKI